MKLLLFDLRAISLGVIVSRKREHSRKPDEQYDLIESCSPGPYLELFARGTRKGWITWGDQANDYNPEWATYANQSQSDQTDPSQQGLFATREVLINAQA